MAMKPGYKQTEVGVLPESWRAACIHRCVRLNAPICYGILMPGDHYDQGVPVVKVRDILGGRIDESNLLRTHPSIDEAYKRSRLCAGDLLITIRGTTGRVALVQKELHGANITQDSARVRISSAESEVFVYYALQSQAVQQQVALHTIGQAVKGINIRDVKDLSIPLPSSLPEQHAIAEALSDADALIESLEHLVAKKGRIKQGAMQELLTGQKRLPGFSDKWDLRHLGEISSIKTGGRNSQDQVKDGQYPFFVRSATVERINSYSHDCEAILVPGEGGVGTIFHYIKGRFDVHQRVYAITQFSQEVSGRFVYFYMAAKFGFHALQNSVKATVDSLRLPTFQNFELTMPPTLKEQSAIAEVLCDIDAELMAFETKLAKTRQIKHGMMQELLTGRIRLDERHR